VTTDGVGGDSLARGGGHRAGADRHEDRRQRQRRRERDERIAAQVQAGGRAARRGRVEEQAVQRVAGGHHDRTGAGGRGGDDRRAPAGRQRGTGLQSLDERDREPDRGDHARERERAVAQHVHDERRLVALVAALGDVDGDEPQRRAVGEPGREPGDRRRWGLRQ
jgi:hypothetical protein